MIQEGKKKKKKIQIIVKSKPIYYFATDYITYLSIYHHELETLTIFERTQGTEIHLYRAAPDSHSK